MGLQGSGPELAMPQIPGEKTQRCQKTAFCATVNATHFTFSWRVEVLQPNCQSELSRISGSLTLKCFLLLM